MRFANIIGFSAFVVVAAASTSDAASAPADSLTSTVKATAKPVDLTKLSRSEILGLLKNIILSGGNLASFLDLVAESVELPKITENPAPKAPKVTVGRDTSGDEPTRQEDPLIKGSNSTFSEFIQGMKIAAFFEGGLQQMQTYMDKGEEPQNPVERKVWEVLSKVYPVYFKAAPGKPTPQSTTLSGKKITIVPPPAIKLDRVGEK